MISNRNIDGGRGIDASLTADKIAEFEKEHLEYLSTVSEKFTIPHYATLLDLKRI